MHIFIDESGIFKSSSNKNQWSSVGALAVPSASLDIVKQALEQLKSDHNIDLDAEFKKDRPGCSSEPYMQFMTKLDASCCTLHVLSTPTTMLDENDIKNHKINTKTAIKRYFETKNIDLEYCREIDALIDTLSNQNYCQCIFQTYLIYDALSKIIPYYSENYPQELARFYWVLDQKDDVETKHERFFKLLYQGLISVTTMSRPWPMLIKESCNYSYFLNSYADKDFNKPDLSDTKRIFNKDMSSIAKNLCTINLDKLLEDNFLIGDSKSNFGLQCIDLLVSSTNRCLKQNYDDNKKMARALGRLMINSPEIRKQSVSIMGGCENGIDDISMSLVSIMDEMAKKQFNTQFRDRYSKY